jgi:RNA polymerase sigma-70 factor (ECF subfamily)
MNCENEKKLIHHAVKGDDKAAHDVLTSNLSRLHRYITSQFPPILREFTTPEDVLQEVYLKASVNIGQLVADDFEEVFAWMTGIARYALIDLQRRFALRRSQNLTNNADDDVVRLLERLVVYRRTPSRSAVEHEFMAAVESSLEKLPDNYRRVVRFRHLDGLSVDETSREMNITPKTVRTLCNRGLIALRSRLEHLLPSA